LAPYAQFNVGLARDFDIPDHQPVTVRFDVVNVFDTIYQIRNGSGIGVFASQYGPRRGFFLASRGKYARIRMPATAATSLKTTSETIRAPSNGRPLRLLSRAGTIGAVSISVSTPAALLA
jgi:hypothetical protein